MTAEELTELALATEPTRRHVELLLRAALLGRITADGDAIAEALFAHGEQSVGAAKAELEQMPAGERDELCCTVDAMLQARLFVTADRLLNAAAVLGFDPDRLDPEHVAVFAMLPAA